MKKSITTLFISLMLIISCQNKPAAEKQIKEVKKEKTFSNKIEIAHKKASFLKHQAIQFEANIEFGGNEVFNAKVSISTTSDIAKITYKNGDEIFVNKETIFVSPSLKDNAGVRFHAYTWNYFFLFPYKLSDNGTKWNDNFKTKETNNPFDTAKLSFGENIGDAPDDWYIVYANKENNLLDHAAYIVTVNKSTEAAEADPHAIKYLNYKEVSGVPFASNWEFYEWNIEQGMSNKIGSAKITNIQFIENFREHFSVPKNYIQK
ncbi:hypothetical protein MC378_02665 [Polaribacter sp. MSW13]|uniref:Heat-shock protein Hsp90 n=1 Tax=Polaribacter marinus TaxID=2916838 RepID=A0A9X1VP54_9FLAO|nr:hypothetical protein [Polaribacter marinus]MCI2228055.1 hypothetical protein [Polaribacter marinus]